MDLVVNRGHEQIISRLDHESDRCLGSNFPLLQGPLSSISVYETRGEPVITVLHENNPKPFEVLNFEKVVYIGVFGGRLPYYVGQQTHNIGHSSGPLAAMERGGVFGTSRSPRSSERT